MWSIWWCDGNTEIRDKKGLKSALTMLGIIKLNMDTKRGVPSQKMQLRRNPEVTGKHHHPLPTQHPSLFNAPKLELEC